MARSDIEIKLHYEWVEVEADAQECLVCGDKCYMFNPMKLEVKLIPFNSIYAMDQVVCKSCYDVGIFD